MSLVRQEQNISRLSAGPLECPHIFGCMIEVGNISYLSAAPLLAGTIYVADTLEAGNISRVLAAPTQAGENIFGWYARSMIIFKASAGPLGVGPHIFGGMIEVGNISYLSLHRLEWGTI